MKQFLKQYGSSLALTGGVLAIAAGAGMIYVPAGLIALGVLTIAWWVLDSLGGGDAP